MFDVIPVKTGRCCMTRIFDVILAKGGSPDFSFVMLNLFQHLIQQILK
ncbi:hypothetical protein [Rickettsia endosymbiont of Aspidapion aeneum]